MEIKTTEEISDAWDKQIGNPPYPLSSKKWVAVDDLIQHIEDSRSPDGDYPDADCIIRDLKRK